jgi:uncharacterized repeat protein (TIGR01451 family)
MSRAAIVTMDSRRVSAVLAAMGSALVVVLLGMQVALATPPAGTVIGNQASATYSDESNTVRTVTSEMVTTIVQQVASVTVSTAADRIAAPGAHVSFPHTITNTGNGSDTFALSTPSNAGGFTLTGVVFYADANGDGVADNTTPITTTDPLAAGATFNVVASGTVPSSATASSVNNLGVTATSTFNNTVSASRTDKTTVGANAIIDVVKAIDVGSGSASGTRTYTLTYTNTGNLSAANLVLTDVIPAGMTYLADSARWSGTGSTTLTDSGQDNQSGIVYDYNETVATRVTAKIVGPIPVGASGTLRFSVQFKATVLPGASQTTNTAQFLYDDGGGATTTAASTNSVAYNVTQAGTLTYTGVTVASGAQGGTVVFINPLTNTGNGTDVFNLKLGTSTFPAGTTFTLYQGDGLTPLVDTNGDGTPDTGPVAASGAYNVVVKAILPANATGGPFTVQSIATSTVTPGASATATDTLTTISTNSVDVTMNSAGGLGVGAGPGVSPLVTNTVSPGSGTRFTLFVTNGAGSTPDSFNLQASTNGSFAALTLPAGWTITFRDTSEAVITNTGVLAPNTSKQVYADVAVPAGTSPQTVSLYFRAISPSSGAADPILDAVNVGTVRSLTLTPSNSGQIFPNGTAVYSHVVTNTGSVLEGDGVASTGTLAIADSQAGFSSTIYWDKNNNGVLDASDPVVTTLADLTGGTNGASTAAGLAAGESAKLFVKVFAPANAQVGVNDATTLTLTMSGVINGMATPSAITATEGSVVVVGKVSLTKLQALDANCDGTPDTGSYGSATLTTGALPGACIRYQITASNLGTADVTNVVISDSTPANTVYVTAGAAAVTTGSISAPANNAAGLIQATVPSLAPTQSSVVTFGVRIQP